MNRVLIPRAPREVVAWTFLALVVVSAAGFAWLTRNPEAPIVAEATEWPVVGVAARLFQERWLPPPRSAVLDPNPTGGSTFTRVFVPVRVVEVEDFFDLPDRPEDPRAIPWSDPILRWDGSGPPPLGSDPLPALPLPGRLADPARLAEARSLFPASPVESRLGRYSLVTDVVDDGLLRALGAAAEEVEPLYGSRYGLTPVGEAAETIVLYRSEESYRLFQARSERIRGLASRGHVGWGMVALYAGEGAQRDAVAPVLRHELGHLLNRRSLGPALPPWLDEGIADDFAAFELDARLAPREPALEAMRRVEENRIEIWGTLASLDQLAREIATGSVPTIPELLGLDWDVFVEEPAADLHYAASAWLVRYLLDESSEAALGFRSFLRGVARGGGAGADDLVTSLGRPWPELDAGFRRYVMERANEAGVGTFSGE
ncbi:MAG TPA: hypothetical protein VMS86_05305 [Thermoanaerobaculia bacterium]|nr:hypothetical protein [Thermoanaerobaculia bacterium]